MKKILIVIALITIIATLVLVMSTGQWPKWNDTESSDQMGVVAGPTSDQELAITWCITPPDISQICYSENSLEPGTEIKDSLTFLSESKGITIEVNEQGRVVELNGFKNTETKRWRIFLNGHLTNDLSEQLLQNSTLELMFE